MWKWLSRKLLVVLVNIGVIALNKQYNLGLSETDTITLAGVSAAYILGQSYQNSRQDTLTK